jgi:hypothetical protein
VSTIAVDPTGRGHLGSPASALDGIRPALYVTAGFALLAALSGLAIRPARRLPAAAPVRTVEAPAPAVEPPTGPVAAR